VTAVALHGATGRMGRALRGLLAEDEAARLVACLTSAGDPLLGKRLDGVEVSADVAGGLARADVVIDFSLPRGTAALAPLAAAAGVPVVSGTTGLDDDATATLREAATAIPIVWAPNMSVGVNLLFHLAEEAARLAGPAYDAEIVEMHHRHKVDAPSGTAVRLAERVATGKGLDPERHVIHGRSGQVGARPDAEIGVMTLRGGGVIGEHTLLLAGAADRLELTHRAQDRSVFARGALRAAGWVQGQAPGLYGMADVLGLTG
jgi:4-hydroxy-tetrahydrodipicolinate reductase